MPSEHEIISIMTKKINITMKNGMDKTRKETRKFCKIKDWQYSLLSVHFQEVNLMKSHVYGASLACG